MTMIDTMCIMYIINIIYLSAHARRRSMSAQPWETPPPPSPLSIHSSPLLSVSSSPPLIAGRHLETRGPRAPSGGPRRLAVQSVVPSTVAPPLEAPALFGVSCPELDNFASTQTAPPGGP